MEKVAKVKKIGEKNPSVTHVDNTARVQTVDKYVNSKFYNLINDFYKITKCLY